MKRSRFLSVCVGVFVALCMVSTARAGLIVTGTETSAGNYSFVFSQAGPLDAVQTKTFIPLNFAITMPGIVAGSMTGSLADGATTLSAALFGWTDLTGTAASFNPNTILGAVSLQAAAGFDFSSGLATWNFASVEMLTGVIQAGTAPMPIPSTLAIFGIGIIGLLRSRRGRSGRVHAG